MVIQSIRRRRPGLRGRPRQIKNKAQASGTLHRRAELARLRRAAGDGHHRPRPRRGARRADHRHRQHADAAGRRRRSRRSSTATPTATTSSPRCRSEFRDNPEQLGKFFVRSASTARWCRCRSVVTIATNASARGDRAVQPAQFGDDLRRCRCPASPPATGSPTIQRDRRGESARGLLHRLFRPVAAGGAAGQHAS